jgi:prepilin-type N-terminal cleavage/methylation domain-containing protein/prepilin-type processing-associated H-X9-DG protein
VRLEIWKDIDMKGHPQTSASGQSTEGAAGRAGGLAFTLIELLVVIAVICILAAILLPALNRAQSASDSAVCKSNLHQVTLGLSMYAQDLGVYPAPGYGEVISGQFVPLEAPFLTAWPVQLQPFVGASWPQDNYAATIVSYANVNETWLGPGQGVYARPGYNRVRGTFSPGWVAGGMITMFGSYAYNDNGCGGQGLAGCYPASSAGRLIWSATRGNQVVSPSDMFAISDSVLIGGVTPVVGLDVLDICFISSPYAPNANAALALTGLPAGDPAVAAERRRHGGRWNMGFCDAHVESLRANQIFDLKNPTVNQRWNIDDQPHIQP